MARGKKKESALTPAEKLEQALVPGWEQPYMVPKNWCWSRLGSIVVNHDAKRVPLSTAQRSKLSKIYDYYGASGVIDKVDNYIFDEELLLIGEDGANLLSRSTDIAFLANGKYWVNNHAHVLDAKETTTNQFLCNYINHIDLSPFVTGSAQPKLTQEKLNSIPIPLPPKSEQQRIVDRIECLFAKLDEAKEKAQSVLDSFETRKAAILHKAFTGELIGKDNAEEACLESIVETIRIGPFGSALHKEDYVHNGVPVVNPKHITGQQIIPEGKVTISYEKAAELASYKLKENDIVLGRRGEMGRSAPVTKEQAGWICGTGSMIIRLKQGYDATFYSQIIASQPVVQYLEENSVGSTLKNLNEKIVRKLPIPNFSLTEQKRTIEILNGILLKEQQAEEAAEAVLEKIDLLKKSILARAFRGELGTNNPTEESALKLLKAVL